MSLAVIDYTDRYVSIDQLPTSPMIIIICAETTLVPDSIKPILLNSVSRSSIINGGIFIIRVSSDLIRGHTIAQVCLEFPDAKIYTPRSAIFTAIVPNFAIENINLPVAKYFKKLKRPAEASKPLENSLFEEVYSESLDKFSKTFLLIPTIRASKLKSLKAQLKNLVGGVIASKAKRFGKMTVDPESVVSAIVEDLDEQQFIINVFGNVEFDDCKLENYFGPRKNSVFVPGSRVKDPAGVQPASQCHPGTADEPDPGRGKGQRQSFSLSQMTQKNFPVFPDPQSKALSIRSELMPKLIPSRPNDCQASSKAATKEGPRGPSRTETLNGSEADWETHDTNIAMLIIDELGANEAMSSIDSCLKLYRLCNRVTREYIEAKALTLSSNDFSERVNKALKLSLDTFFIADSDKNNEQILKDVQNHLNIKLKVNKF